MSEHELRAIVLVEGESDRAALLACANTLGIDLTDVQVIATHGITNFRRHLVAARRDHDGVPIYGLHDAAEEQAVRRQLADPDLTGAASTRLYRCDVDLEDELIRALGVGRAVALVAELGEASRFEKMRQQPAWRDMPLDAQLHRFMGIRSGRKVRYAGAFAAAISVERMPAPLRRLLEDVRSDE